MRILGLFLYEILSTWLLDVCHQCIDAFVFSVVNMVNDQVLTVPLVRGS